MKIGKSLTNVKLSLSETERSLLGNPDKISLKITPTGLIIFPDAGGNSLHRNDNDSRTPWCTHVSTTVGRAWPVFGTEELKTTCPMGSKELHAPGPKMNRPLRIRKSGVVKDPPVTIVSDEMVDEVKKALTAVAVDLTPSTLDTADILAEAVQYVNKRKAELGKNLLLQIDENGFLEVMQRIGV